MAANDGQEKTEQPTGKKLNESREKGQVAKSTEINSWAIFAGSILILSISENLMGSNIKKAAISIFSSLDTLTLSRDLVIEFSKDGLLFLLLIMAPILGGLVIISLIASYGQVGFKLSPKALAPKISKFNPISGLKKFVSPSALVETIKSVLKLAIIGIFTYIVIKDIIAQTIELPSFSIPEIIDFMINAAHSLLWKIAMIYSVLAVSDFIYQKYKFKKDMMMTREEVKEENKQSDGDPQIKSRIRKVMMEMSANRMILEVPKADVVITNPTHYAIAIKYEMNNDSAPKVVAKGVDELAQRIKKIAVENNVPLHEDRPLARALYDTCKIGDQIPANLFKAVARILAYIYQLKNTKKRKSII